MAKVGRRLAVNFNVCTRTFGRCRRAVSAVGDAGARLRSSGKEAVKRLNRPFVLALDQGTTSSRALLFDAAGRVAAARQREFRQIYPRPGWVEHDPEEIWRSQLQVARDVLQAAGATAEDVAAIGIANQRETTLLWDRASGEPVANAIVWQDRRTAAMCRQLTEAGLEDGVRSKTGLVIDPYFSGTKLAWLLEHVPGVRARAERGELAFGTVDSWLIYKLTGGRVHGTDVTNASRTMMFNIHTLQWDEELLAMFGDIPPRCCRTCCRRATFSAKRSRRSSEAPSPSAARRGISRPLCSGKAASHRARRKTRTARAVSC